MQKLISFCIFASLQDFYLFLYTFTSHSTSFQNALATHATSTPTGFQLFTLLCVAVLKSQVQDIEKEKNFSLYYKYRKERNNMHDGCKQNSYLIVMIIANKISNIIFLYQKMYSRNGYCFHRRYLFSRYFTVQ